MVMAYSTLIRHWTITLTSRKVTSMCRSMSTSSIAPYSLYFVEKEKKNSIPDFILDKTNSASVINLCLQQLLWYIFINTRKWQEYITLQNMLLTVKHKAFRDLKGIHNKFRNDEAVLCLYKRLTKHFAWKLMQTVICTLF